MTPPQAAAAARVAALEERVEELAATPPDEALPQDALDVVEELLACLEAGEVRAATVGADGRWAAVPWVKRGILLAFRAGVVAPTAGTEGGVPAGDAAAFYDKHTLPLRRFRPSDRVRIVPGGSAVRRGAYVAPGVVCMPPMYVNVGAWVGSGTMIDSHALVGSCAQVGERVHVSAAAQLGGVLEPVNASPVVVEDDVVIGGNTGVYEGTIVRRRAVLGAGVVLTRATPVFDLVRQTVHRAEGGRPLEIPADAVVVAGARAVRTEWGKEQGLSLYTPVIVKYRDEKTDLATALEGWLR
ncbi:MAG TPA: 2,3,4,5-tetrahydropyridine-2,6-dicarboxylate N-succinyltransferase [Longimicrobiales bacterium]|nr:2,3,4,5-tetrahydropyridine-2,6-dicarboxylate N-succinyltransferase [Longimicrobiales bacterium]